MHRILFNLLFLTTLASAQDYGPLVSAAPGSATAAESVRQTINDALNMDREILIRAVWEAFARSGELDPTVPESFISILYRRLAVESIKQFRAPDRPWYQAVLDRDAANVYTPETRSAIDARKTVIEAPLEVKQRPTPTPTATPSGGGR